ncbi:MAG: hypothetical protein ACTSXF_09985 [Promethearchaeota archaeon]
MRTEFPTLIGRSKVGVNLLLNVVNRLLNGLKSLKNYEIAFDYFHNIIIKNQNNLYSFIIDNKGNKGFDEILELFNQNIKEILINKSNSITLQRLKIDLALVINSFNQLLNEEIVNEISNLHEFLNSIKSRVQIIKNRLVLKLYKKFIQNEIAEIESRSNLTKEAGFVLNYIYEIKNILDKRLWDNFSLEQEIENYNIIKSILEDYNWLLTEENEKLPFLNKFIDNLSEYLFPRGSNFEELFGKFINTAHFFELQKRMLLSETSTDDRNIKRSYCILSHIMAEIIEKITEILNTDPTYIRFPMELESGVFSEALVPGFNKNRIFEAFIGKIATPYKQYIQNFMEKLGFIAILEEEANKQAFEDDFGDDELESLDNNDFLDSSNEIITNSSKPTKKTVKKNSSKKKSSKKKSKKSKKSKKEQKQENEREFFILQPIIIKILEKHGLFFKQNVHIDKTQEAIIKFIPALNTETFYQILLTHISLERKHKLSRQLANKIAGYFAMIIYYFIIIRNIKEMYNDSSISLLRREYEKNPLLKVLNDLDIKIYLITRLKKLISYPFLLNLDYKQIDDTNIYGRDIFQYMGSENETILNLLFELIEKIDFKNME